MMEPYEGKSSFGETRIRAKNRIDCCHNCWIEICSKGYAPNFVEEYKNPKWVRGSKIAGERYYEPVPDNQSRSIAQEKLTAT